MVAFWKAGPIIFGIFWKSERVGPLSKAWKDAEVVLATIKVRTSLDNVMSHLPTLTSLKTHDTVSL